MSAKRPASQAGSTGTRRPAYGVLSRGLLSGSRPAGAKDFRAYLPRFAGDNLALNQKLVAVLQQVAGDLNASASQVAIAWVAAKGRRQGWICCPWSEHAASRS